MLASWRAKIANQALTEVGFSPIDNVLNSKTEGGKLIHIHLDTVIVRTLSEAKFGVLNKSVLLSTIQNKDGYRVPPDLLRFVGLAGIDLNFPKMKIDGSLYGVNKGVSFPIFSGLFTPDVHVSDTIYQQYEYTHLVYTSLDETKISPQLHESIVLNLAAKISNKMTGGDPLKKASINREARRAMDSAISLNSDDNSTLLGTPPMPFMGGGRRRL